MLSPPLDHCQRTMLHVWKMGLQGMCASFKGQFFCSKACAPAFKPAISDSQRDSIQFSSPGANTSTQDSIQAISPFWKKVVLYSAAVLFTSGLAYGVWSVKEITRLRNENAFLNENRSALIAGLKRNNKEIELLTEKLNSQNTVSPLTVSLTPPSVLSTGKSQSMKFPVTPDGVPYTFNNGATDKHFVSITFDGGSTSNSASDILDTLRSRNVKTTMFLTGQFIRKYPDLVKRIISDGHEIGNHTLDHKHLTTWAMDKTQASLPYVNQEFIASELFGAEKILKDKTGGSFVPLWRSPFGEFNPGICRMALSCGYVHIGWRQGQSWKQSLDSNDWIADQETPGYKTPGEVIEKIMTMAETNPDGINGGIILMHLGSEREGPNQVYHVVGKLIDSLRADGYKIIPVTEMMRLSGIDYRKLTAIEPRSPLIENKEISFHFVRI